MAHLNAGLVALWFSGDADQYCNEPYIFVIFQGGSGPPDPPLDPPMCDIVPLTKTHTCSTWLVCGINSECWVIFHVFVVCWFFIKSHPFRKILSRILFKCQTVWIQTRPDILSGLVWVQTVFKGNQQTTVLKDLTKFYISGSDQLPDTQGCADLSKTLWCCT